jgi:hypothetical protein
MDDFLQRDVAYFISLREVLWGGALLALTLIIHGFGMLCTLRVSGAVQERSERARSRYPALGLGIVILGTWIIVLTNLIEVGAWAGFYVWRGAQPNLSSAYYHALLNFCTIQAGYLPLRWRLLEGMLAASGVLTFAWSTGILFALAQDFQEKALLAAKRGRGSALPGRVPRDLISRTIRTGREHE